MNGPTIVKSNLKSILVFVKHSPGFYGQGVKTHFQSVAQAISFAEKIVFVVNIWASQRYFDQ